MLLELVVKNLALAEDVTIEFSPGLNVLTGETGAGKSIIIGALGLLIGARASAEAIRTGCDSAVVEGLFDVPAAPDIISLLNELNIELSEEDAGIILAREISSNGRNRCRVNGRNVTLSQFKALGSVLVDICGQHENQSLFSNSKQLMLLDKLGGHPLYQCRESVESLYKQIRSLINEEHELATNSKEIARRIDLLSHQLSEIEEAGLEKFDEDQLKQQKIILSNADRLLNGATKAYALLADGDDRNPSVLDALGAVSHSLEILSKLDPAAVEFIAPIDEAIDKLHDASRALRIYRDSVDHDPEKLAEIEDTLDIISKLKRKYGDSISDILTYARTIKTELDSITNSEERLHKLVDEIKKHSAVYIAEALKLSSIRVETAARLKSLLETELRELNMSQAVFSVNIHKEPADAEMGIDVAGEHIRYGSHGIDYIEFLLSPNPGEDLKSLAKIASGGELSRILLAVKTVLGRFDDVPTMVFDEIDAGIGGRTATSVAVKLAEIGVEKQVICVTHLAQIACMGDRHFNISKEIAEGRTRTTVTCLTDDERVSELVRMLGSEETEHTVHHAREMLESAHELKTGFVNPK